MPTNDGFREEVFNIFLASILNEKGIISVPEYIRHSPLRGRRMPDIAIAEFFGIKVIIEGKIFEDSSTESKLISAAKSRIDEGLCQICIAVIYPKDIRLINYEKIKETLENTSLRINILTDYDITGWESTNVNELSAILRRVYNLLVRDDVVNNTVVRLEEVIDLASTCFNSIPAMPIRLRNILGIYEDSNDSNHKDNDLRICRIASLAIINAQIFQEVLSSIEARVSTIRRIQEQPNIISAFSDNWKIILDEIDYVPIFKITREILLELPSSPETNEAIKLLSNEALLIAANRSALKHDLMGRIYHRLLVDAKYLGAYYTMIPSATLLLELTFDPRYWEIDFGNQKDICSLKVADLACGTGTLLKAALESIIDDYITNLCGAKPNLKEIYKSFIESVLYGYDVLPFAAHLTASALALHAPDIPINRTNLYVLPLGGEGLRLGSLDFLPASIGTIHMQQDLFGVFSTSSSRVTGKGDVTTSARIPNLDLCVMNPPFTRSVGGNLLFGSCNEIERGQMQKKLKEIVSKEKIQANITAGLGSTFVALANKYLKRNGHLALVLPKTFLSGPSWDKTRNLISEDYSLRYVIVSHQPDAWNFSENTHLSECLIIADRNGNSKLPEHCMVINLWKRPSTNIEALSLSSLIQKAPNVIIEQNGICNLELFGTKYGEAISIPSSEAMGNLCNLATAFAQTELIRVAFYLSKGFLYSPGEARQAPLPITKLECLFEIGFDRRDIHDGFDILESQTDYPAIWGNDSDRVTKIRQEPNRYLSPLPNARPNRHLRDSRSLWEKSGRLLIAERIRINTSRVYSIRSQENVLSNVWWTLKYKGDDSRDEDTIKIEKILSLWLNSTLGIIQLLSVRTETEGPWIEFKKPNLESLYILDPRKLNSDQIGRLIQLYETVSNRDLHNIGDLRNDETRALIDETLASILNLPNYRRIRELLAREPIVSLRSLSDIICS